MSRKFLVTIFILSGTIVLAAMKAMTPEVAGVFSAVGFAYNAAQGFVDVKQKG